MRPRRISSSIAVTLRCRAVGSVRGPCALVGKPDVIEATDKVSDGSSRTAVNLRHYEAWYLEFQPTLPSFVQSKSPYWSSATIIRSMDSFFLNVAA